MTYSIEVNSITLASRMLLNRHIQSLSSVCECKNRAIELTSVNHILIMCSVHFDSINLFITDSDITLS